MREKKRLRWIRVLAVLAILVSIYLTYQHYQKEDSDFCVFGESFNCNIVNKSPYANVDGIFHFLVYDLGLDFPFINIPLPNAIISIIVFAYIFLAAGSLSMGKPLFGMKKRTLITTLKTLLYLSLAYAIYLAYIEAFILLNYCIFCIILDVLIVAVLWLVIGLHQVSKKAPVVKQVKKKSKKKVVKKRRRRR